MGKFLWSGKTASGQEVVDEIEAESAEAARKIMEGRGCSDLRLHTGEINDFIDEQMRKSSPPEYAPDLSPKQRLEFLEGKSPGMLRKWFKAVIESGGTILFLLALFAWTILLGSTLLSSFFLLLLLIVLLLFPVLNWWFRRTQTVFRQLHRASSWRRWNEVLECIEKLKKLRTSTKIGIPEVTLERYRAKALAGFGRLEEAIPNFLTVAEEEKMPKWLSYTQLASIYTVAKQYDLALESYRLALQEAPDNSIVLLDLGTFLVTRFNSPEDARRLLAKAEASQLSEHEKCHVPRLLGGIAYQEKDFAAVDKNIREALAGFERHPKKKYYIYEPSILICKGYLAVSCAALGDKAAAKAYFAQSEKYLEAVCLDDIIAKYHEKMGE
jgi:tetratricopeptide (TPR) repeat protein